MQTQCGVSVYLPGGLVGVLGGGGLGGLGGDLLGRK